MNLIVETDLGHDPDDLFALLYLIAAKVNIRLILLYPGHQYQLQLAQMLIDLFGLDCQLAPTKYPHKYVQASSIHRDILSKYYRGGTVVPTKHHSTVIAEVLQNDSLTQLLVLGPVTGIGNYLGDNTTTISKATMQGGFLPYNLYKPNKVVSKFENRLGMQTFNLNGDIKAGQKFLQGNIQERRMVGKNVCHSVIFHTYLINQIKPTCKAGEVFLWAAKKYYEKNGPKKFHDPTAACLHLNPEIGTWVRGKTIRQNGEWTTQLQENGDYILADIDYIKFWESILGGL